MAAADPSPLGAASLFARARAALEEESFESASASMLELIADVLGAETGGLFFEREGELKDEHWHGSHPSETEDRLRDAARAWLRTETAAPSAELAIVPVVARGRPLGVFCF